MFGVGRGWVGGWGRNGDGDGSWGGGVEGGGVERGGVQGGGSRCSNSSGGLGVEPFVLLPKLSNLVLPCRKRRELPSR